MLKWGRISYSSLYFVFRIELYLGVLKFFQTPMLLFLIYEVIFLFFQTYSCLFNYNVALLWCFFQNKALNVRIDGISRVI